MIPPASVANQMDETESLCTFFVGGRSFAVDTLHVREVLGARVLQTVPLAAAYIAGMMPHRGEVLSTLNLQLLLGLQSLPDASSRGRCVMVMEEKDGGERFGLLVDSVGGVVPLGGVILEANPSTLDRRSQALCQGSYAMPGGLVVRLSEERLSPSRLARNTLFKVSVLQESEDRCAL